MCNDILQHKAGTSLLKNTYDHANNAKMLLKATPNFIITSTHTM